MKLGMRYGNHSFSHPHVANINYERNIEEIVKTSEAVKAITGEGTRLYRGPYGEYNDTVIRAARSANHVAIQWNIDSLDYRSLTGEEMWGRIQPKLINGSIILMHSGTEHTATSLDMLITNIKEAGFEIVRVSDIILTENYTIDHAGVQQKN